MTLGLRPPRRRAGRDSRSSAAAASAIYTSACPASHAAAPVARPGQWRPDCFCVEPDLCFSFFFSFFLLFSFSSIQWLLNLCAQSAIPQSDSAGSCRLTIQLISDVMQIAAWCGKFSATEVGTTMAEIGRLQSLILSLALSLILSLSLVYSQ